MGSYTISSLKYLYVIIVFPQIEVPVQYLDDIVWLLQTTFSFFDMLFFSLSFLVIMIRYLSLPFVPSSF